MKKLTLLFCVLASVLFVETTTAGVLYARRPGTESPVYNLTISKIRTTVTVVGQLAVTHVDEEFFNDNQLTLEGFYAFQLPDGARVNGLWLWENGVRRTFVCLKKEDAERKYDSVVIGVRRDPAILESLGANRFQLKVFPIAPNSSRRIEIQYFTTLPYTPDGYIHFRYPLNMQGYQTVPVDVTEMQFTVTSQRPILDLQTNFDSNPLLNQVQRTGDNSFSIRFGQENQNYTQDYELRYRPEALFTVFPSLSWKDPADPAADPYFIAWHPLQEDSVSSSPSRDIVFVLDASGSMGGSRIAAVRTAVKNIISQLRPTDRFRVVLFSSNAISYPTNKTLLDATPENIGHAHAFIDRYYEASGITNFEAAFIAALDASFRSEADRRMLFLTDGDPNAGKTTLSGLLGVIQSYDHTGMRIYPVVFYSASVKLLGDIVAARGGKLTNVESTDNLETIISRLLLDLEVGGFLNTAVQYNEGKTYLVYPTSFPPVTTTDQLVTTGRWTGDGRENATVTYSPRSGGARAVSRDLDLNASLVPYKEVGGYWASKRIDALLADITRFGELPELKQSVINLSIKHSILTPYTAFLVLETNPIDPPTDATGAGAVPDRTALESVHPNPVALSTGSQAVIRFTVGRAAQVRIVITDLLGRIVRVLLEDSRNPGSYTAVWNARDDSNRAVPPGVYFVRMTAGNTVSTLRILATR